MTSEYTPADPDSERRIGSNRRKRLSAAVAAAALGLLPACSVTDQAPMPPPIHDTCTPLKEELYTHIPDEDKAERGVSEFGQDLLCSIEGTQAGDTIKIATYKIHDEDIGDALIEAYKRGVAVQVVMDSSRIATYANPDEPHPVVAALLETLGTDITQPSFMRTCDGACTSEIGKGIQHAKVFVIKRADGSEVVAIGSSNLSPDNLIGASIVDGVTDDPRIARAAIGFFDELVNPTGATQTTIQGLATSEFSFRRTNLSRMIR